MKVRLHVEDPDDMILMVRAVKSCVEKDKDKIPPWRLRQNAGRGQNTSGFPWTHIIEFENGHSFQVDRTMTGYSVWRLK